ncbi:MAG: drug/metabolite exporter YedA [Deltaproteobacteria bacterium]|nr:drug/metabolite exporter YedA [Deltaproteobacteria bacterium]
MVSSEKKAAGSLVLLSLFSVYILWGSTYLAIRIAIESFPPFFMAGVRFFVTGSVLFLLLKLRGADTPTLPQWKGSAIIGAFLLLVGNGGVVFAEQWVGSGIAALGVATVPLWTVVFGGIVWKRWPNRIEFVGLILGFIGIVLLNFEGDMRAYPLGAAGLLIAAVSWAFGSAWSRELALPKGLMAPAAEMITGGFFLLVLSYFSGESLSGPPSWRSVWALAYLMIFGALIGYSAYTYLINRVRPALATSYAYVNPAIAVTLGIFAAGEKITEAGFVAMLVIITAVMLVLFGQRR